MKNKRQLFLILICCMSILSITAQTDQVEMADALRANGKIYNVVAVLSAVFIGIAVYLFYIDRKVKKIEDQLKNK
jgi:CcmD family protein